jgi:cytochrome oxidase Cu insertion factor (SCO1/SenC/PrrC family)
VRIPVTYFGSGGTVGEKARAELFQIRHLSVGKEAPDIEGEDQDGKRFKLSDYKGKVVLLDFWYHL